MTTLASTVTASTLGDELAIRRLYAAYTYAVDDFDNDAVVEMFTADAVLDVSHYAFFREAIATGKLPFLDRNGRAIGRASIRAVFDLIPNSIVHLHVAGNLEVKHLSGDSADVRAAFSVFADDGAPWVYGRYLDKLQRCDDGRWRFRERVEVCRYERTSKPFDQA